MRVNAKLLCIEQINNQKLQALLREAYKVGTEMGTPSDNTKLAIPYVQDFKGFLNKFCKNKGRLLEVGAGTGYMSKCFVEEGWKVTSIEPGVGYESYWEKYGIEVIRDFFPSPEIKGKFDVIVLFTVLEHITNPQEFLNSIKQHLKKNGQVFFVVPDCTKEIRCGDLGMLLHEHFHYYTKESLTLTLMASGIKPTVISSKYGRSLFAVGEISESLTHCKSKTDDQLESLVNYVSGVTKTIQKVRELLSQWIKDGEVGVYCPSRLLNYLPHSENIMFYDDSETLYGKYYPPFRTPISSRKEFIGNQPKRLLVASRTFGQKIISSLRKDGATCEMYDMNNLLSEEGKTH